MKIVEWSRDHWDRYTQNCLMSSVYQDSRWLDLISTIYPKLRIHRLACVTAEDRPLWLLPLVEIQPLGQRRPMLISLPFGNYGGFMFPGHRPSDLTPEILAPLSNFFAVHPAFALEIRTLGFPGPAFEVDETFKRFEIIFPETIAELWRKVSGNVRTSVRKADSLGVTVEVNPPKAIQIFQKIHERQSKWHGSPEHHGSWYGTMKNILGRDAEVWVARYRGRPIASLLILFGHQSAVLHGAASEPEYYKIPAMEKLIWAGFEKMIREKKVRSFDFGRTRPDKGKLFFKRKWGGEEFPIYYAYWVKPGKKLPKILPENPRFDIPMRIWRMLPVPLTRLAGPFLRVKIPT